MKHQKQTIQQIREHSRHLVRELDVVKGVYLGTGYTFTQCHVLFEISRSDSLGLMELADALLIDKSNASRTVKKLISLGLIKSKQDKNDQRQKFFSLTAKGKVALNETVNLANDQVETALENLNVEEHQIVIQGMKLYAEALRKGRLQTDYTIRKIRKQDNPSVASVIRDVMTEFNAVGDGYSIGDPEVDDMYSNYKDERSRYYVIEFEDEIVGCGGVAQLKGGGKTTCELRKMFFRSETRGRGLGKRLLIQLLKDARSLGYKKCYLETLDRMEGAIALYERNGFERLDAPWGNTGHCSCERYYGLDL